MDFNKMKEQIKDNSIEVFCNQNGIKTLGNGRYKRLEEHNSCVIDTNRNIFYWNSQRKNGDVINFVQAYYDIDFKSAIEIISGKKIEDFKETEIHRNKYKSLNTHKSEKIDFKMELDETDERYNRLFAYLNKTRKISYKTISDFVDRKLISQDKKGNINFKFADEHGKINFSKKGSTDKPFNYIDTESDIRGFRYIPQDNIPKEEINTMYVFESPIDLMSYTNLSNVSNEKAVLISMNGLKHNSVLKNLIDFPNVEFLHLCVDNDIAGKNFIKYMKELQSSREYEVINNKIIIDHTPEKYKDWNDFLKYIVSVKEMDCKKESEEQNKGIREKLNEIKKNKEELINNTKENETKSYEKGR